jgi:transcriptional repressor NrdR
MLVIKKDGRREEFSRDKIIAGIRKACAKRPVSQEAIEQMVDDIESRLRRSGKGEIAASVIGDLVMEELRYVDGIAYIRFASVYRDFADIEEVRAAADTYVNLRLLRSDTSQLPLFADVSSSPDITEGEIDVVAGEKSPGNPVKK